MVRREEHEVEWTTRTGKFKRVVDASHNVLWYEYSDCGTHTFTFKEVFLDRHVDPKQVILHDTQRDKFVRLTTEKLEWSDDCLSWKALSSGGFGNRPQQVRQNNGDDIGLVRLWQGGGRDCFFFCLKLLLFFGLVGGAIRWKGMEESNVLEMHADDFKDLDEMEPGATPYFVDFFAPWCGHCRELMPVWEELAEVTMLHLTVAKVDCEAESKVLHSQSIQAFPTLILYRPDTEPLSYQGGRDLDSIVTWLKSNKVLPTDFTYDKEEYRKRAAERKKLKEAEKAASEGKKEENEKEDK